MMKKICLIIILLTLYFHGFSQEKKKDLYFFADTINVTRENRMLGHGYVDNAFEYFFTFYCKCLPPYRGYTIFSYINKKGEKKAEIVSRKPKFDYLSFKELMDIVSLDYQSFNSKYNLYITELLPKNKYRTNRVVFIPPHITIDDSVIIKDQ